MSNWQSTWIMWAILIDDSRILISENEWIWHRCEGHRCRNPRYKLETADWYSIWTIARLISWLLLYISVGRLDCSGQEQDTGSWSYQVSSGRLAKSTWLLWHSSYPHRAPFPTSVWYWLTKTGYCNLLAFMMHTHRLTFATHRSLCCANEVNRLVLSDSSLTMKPSIFSSPGSYRKSSSSRLWSSSNIRVGLPEMHPIS